MSPARGIATHGYGLRLRETCFLLTVKLEYSGSFLVGKPWLNSVVFASFKELKIVILIKLNQVIFCSANGMLQASVLFTAGC